MTPAEVIAIKPINRLKDLGRATDLVHVDPRNIVIEQGFNPRDFSTDENKASLARLKESIRAVGVQNPLWVRLDGKKDNKVPVLVDGESRLKMVLELIAEGVDIKTVPTIQKSDLDSPAQRLVMAMTANESQPLSQMEIGLSYKKLQNYGWEVAQIATTVGKSERYVREAIAISGATPEVKALVNSGEVTQSMAIKATKENGEQAAEVLKAAVEEKKAKGEIGPVKAPKQDSKAVKEIKEQAAGAGLKLKAITEVIEEFEAVEGSEWTKDELIKLFADIADIVEGNMAAIRARVAA